MPYTLPQSEQFRFYRFQKSLILLQWHPVEPVFRGFFSHGSIVVVIDEVVRALRAFGEFALSRQFLFSCPLCASLGYRGSCQHALR